MGLLDLRLLQRSKRTWRRMLSTMVFAIRGRVLWDAAEDPMSPSGRRTPETAASQRASPAQITRWLGQCLVWQELGRAEWKWNTFNLSGLCPPSRSRLGTAARHDLNQVPAHLYSQQRHKSGSAQVNGAYIPTPRGWWHTAASRRKRRNWHPLCTKEVLHWDALPSMSRTLLSSLPLPQPITLSLHARTLDRNWTSQRFNLTFQLSHPWNTTADHRPHQGVKPTTQMLQRSADPESKIGRSADSSAPSSSPTIQCQPHWSMLLQ